MNENESKSVVKDEGTSGARSEWVGSWWQLIALMSVSAVIVTGIIVIGREMEAKKEYVQASESAGKLKVLEVTDKHKRSKPIKLRITTDRWIYTAQGSFAALLESELTEETLGNGSRQLCATGRAICVPIEGRVPVAARAEAGPAQPVVKQLSKE